MEGLERLRRRGHVASGLRVPGQRHAAGAPRQRAGLGRVDGVRGDYYDALARKRNPTIVFLVENTGGISPQPLARLRRNARLATPKGARDSTKYGTARVSPRSYFTHHTQQMSKAAVMYDAMAIRKRLCSRRRSPSAPHMWRRRAAYRPKPAARRPQH